MCFRLKDTHRANNNKPNTDEQKTAEAILWATGRGAVRAHNTTGWDPFIPVCQVLSTDIT